MTKQLSIRLADTQVEQLRIEQVKYNENDSVDISFSNAFNKENPREFILQFHIILPHKQNINFEVKYNALFQTNEDITEEFMKSDFTSINAPAIAYPFLRSYVATLLTLSGYNPLMLPTINFLENTEINKSKVDLD